MDWPRHKGPDRPRKPDLQQKDSTERTRVATSSLTLRNRKSVHPAVAHTVDALLLEERTKWAIHIHDGLTQSVTSAVLELQGLQHRIRTEPEDVLATLHEVEVRDPERSQADPSDPLRARRGHTASGTLDRQLRQRAGGALAPPRARLDRGRGGSDPGSNARDGERDHGRSDGQRGEALRRARRCRYGSGPGLDELRIEVEDRGNGIVAADADGDPHFGLRLMRDQAERIGGTIEIESNPGSGTRVVAVLPVGGRGDEG